MPRQAAERWIRYVSSYSTGGTAFDKAEERRATLLANAEGIFADGDSALSTIDEPRLASIRVPTTLIQANLSPPFLRRSCARLRKLLPHARVVTIENAGHHITIDARDELLEILRDAMPPTRSADTNAPAPPLPPGL